ncbi:MAG: hypothetical protein C0594_01270 [Marinilabiliales bacterium]|nr:MAG: hypothetical protein C0594_01270 [Marinilabiliales bacterium]
MLEEARALAEKVITKQERLLLKMAAYLADNSQMNSEAIKVFVSKYKVSQSGNVEYFQYNDSFYRSRLFGKVKSFHDNTNEIARASNQYRLNSKDQEE